MAGLPIAARARPELQSLSERSISKRVTSELILRAHPQLFHGEVTLTSASVRLRTLVAGVFAVERRAEALFGEGVISNTSGQNVLKLADMAQQDQWKPGGQVLVPTMRCKLLRASITMTQFRGVFQIDRDPQMARHQHQRCLEEHMADEGAASPLALPLARDASTCQSRL